ncbi:MAG: GNAT family N-acetyltransferase [Bacteroidota bacterium]
MKKDNIQCIETNQTHLNSILQVEELAFNSKEESMLVKNLLEDKTARPVVSLLAMHKKQAVGHILFTRAFIENSPECRSYILAPLAVVPSYQKQGIGGLLIREGLSRLRAMNVDYAFVLGHTEYYPKHGFIPDAAHSGFPAPYPIPEKDKDAWMMMKLNSGDLRKITGKGKCAVALDKPEYWRE